MLGGGSYLNMYFNAHKYLYNISKRGLRITARRYIDDGDDDDDALEYDNDGKMMARGDDGG